MPRRLKTLVESASAAKDCEKVISVISGALGGINEQLKNISWNRRDYRFTQQQVDTFLLSRGPLRLLQTSEWREVADRQAENWRETAVGETTTLGETVDGQTEGRGETADGQTEELEETVDGQTEGRGKTVAGQTEEIPDGLTEECGETGDGQVATGTEDKEMRQQPGLLNDLNEKKVGIDFAHQ